MKSAYDLVKWPTILCIMYYYYSSLNEKFQDTNYTRWFTLRSALLPSPRPSPGQKVVGPGPL